MPQFSKNTEMDLDVRHFIYCTFAQTALPPTPQEIARQFRLPISEAEQSLERLAEAHQIALSPGSHVVWMAHPFSALPTNFIARVGGKRFWGN